MDDVAKAALIGSKGPLDTGMLDHLIHNVTVHPKIIELTVINVAGLRGETTLRDNRLRELWSRASALYTQIPGKVLPGGRYAVFTHRGTLQKLPQTFDYIWGTWFLTSEEEIDFREDFELYDEHFLGYEQPDSEVDLYIPVK